MFLSTSHPAFLFLRCAWAGRMHVPSPTDVNHASTPSSSTEVIRRLNDLFASCNHLTLSVDSWRIGRWLLAARIGSRMFCVQPRRRLLARSKFSVMGSLLTFSTPTLLALPVVRSIPIGLPAIGWKEVTVSYTCGSKKKQSALYW